nr:venom acid phosphatase Acph-1-like isoform X2 [Onthophagus taurus]
MKTKKDQVVVYTMLGFGLSFLGLIIYGASARSTANTKQLLLTNVICRHGARTPVDTYPNDPYLNYSFSPIGWGHLTNEGKLDLYNLGKDLRNRYKTFLSKFYYPNLYKSQSTDSDRTLSSVQLINAGLWEPRDTQKWGPINWQPIPVRYEALNEDKLLLVRVPCAQYEIELKKVIESEPIQEIYKKNKNLFEYVSKSTGKDIKNFDDLQDVFTTLKAEESFNLTLPEWTVDYYPQKMYEPTAFSFYLRTYNKKLIRLKAGLLLKRIIENIKSKINYKETESTSSKDVNMYLYGGHDATIANILSALNLFEGEQHVPDYAATILIETYVDRVDNQYYIEVYYRKSVNDVFQMKTIPGCAKSCRFDKFLDLLQEYIPGDWEKECYTDDPNFVPPPPIGP